MHLHKRKAIGELFFVYSLPIQQEGQLTRPSLLRIKTDAGAPHIAFKSYELAQHCIKYRDVDPEHSIVSSKNLTSEFYFDFKAYGILLFESATVLNQYLNDPGSFPYKDHIINYQHPVTSKTGY